MKKFKKMQLWLQKHRIKKDELEFANLRVEINGENYLLCRALVPDIPEMYALQRQVYPQDASWDPTVFESELQDQAHKIYFILRYNDQLVAFIGGTFAVRSKDVHITNVAVMPLFQERGLGSFLLKKMIAYAAQHSFKTITLEARLSNVRAQRLYAALGFKNNGLTKNYYQSNREDAINMKYVIKKEKRESKENE
ncbi:ribosomal protein S18-alanine N-acetyltransferase [Liquorilactobacillus satsumensis]|uniref:ribosomal protein S18-alanine N-acetyltransferase n=1 Tax=Liquorilactobacillus satsumensis TaxID=259059 RepID=UPI0039E7D2AB